MVFTNEWIKNKIVLLSKNKKYVLHELKHRWKKLNKITKSYIIHFVKKQFWQNYCFSLTIFSWKWISCAFIKMKDAGSMIWDYLVFLIFIVATTFVAVYNRYAGPKEKTKADYVFATGSVSMAAMMLSIARGTLGVRSFLGKSADR